MKKNSIRLYEKGNNLNSKLTPDSFKAVIHFADEAKDLSCPADLIVVDRSKFIKTAYIPVKDDPHTHLKKLFGKDYKFYQPVIL